MEMVLLQSQCWNRFTAQTEIPLNCKSTITLKWQKTLVPTLLPWNIYLYICVFDSLLFTSSFIKGKNTKNQNTANLGFRICAIICNIDILLHMQSDKATSNLWSINCLRKVDKWSYIMSIDFQVWPIFAYNFPNLHTVNISVCGWV